jgi:hypothetical protein
MTILIITVKNRYVMLQISQVFTSSVIVSFKQAFVIVANVVAPKIGSFDEKKLYF